MVFKQDYYITTLFLNYIYHAFKLKHLFNFVLLSFQVYKGLLTSRAIPGGAIGASDSNY
jgi:hypothetical protein